MRRRTGPKAPKYPKPDDGDVQFRNFSGKVMAIVMARNLVDVEVPGPARAGIGILLERPEDLLIDRGALVAWIADGPDAPAVAIETFTNGQLHGGHMDGSTPRREFMAHLDARAPEIHKEARWWAGRRRKKLLARVAERAEAAMAEAKPKRRGKKP